MDGSLVDKALALIMGKPSPGLAVGTTIVWMSPLFGRCEGSVLMADEQEVLVDHPITGEPAWILRRWIIREPEKEKPHACPNEF